MQKIKFNNVLELGGPLVFHNMSKFPADPVPYSMIVKNGSPYIYTESCSGSGKFVWVKMTFNPAEEIAKLYKAIAFLTQIDELGNNVVCDWESIMDYRPGNYD